MPTKPKIKGDVVIDPTRVRTEVPQFASRGNITTVNPFGDRPSKNGCNDSRGIIALAGRGQTDDQGKWRLKLEDVICRDDNSRIGETPVVVATAKGEKPRILTSSFKVVAGAPTIEIQSWTPTGRVAKGVPFAWHCIVPSIFVVG